MRKKSALVCLCLSIVCLSLPASQGTAKEPVDALVSVVSLDGRGNPQRQGMGILLSKDGNILTSAGILANCRAGIVKSADGTLHEIRKITQWNSFQDAALLQIESGSPGLAAVETAPRFQPPETVWVGVRGKAGFQMQETQLAKALPFSPRLMLLKLQPAIPEAEPGSPILNRRGELVGMLHTFAADQETSPASRFYLARDRDHPALGDDARKENLSWREEPLKSSVSPVFQAFWEGVESSLRQEWKEAQKKFNAAITEPDGLPEAYYGRGVARYHLGDWAGAEKDLEKASQGLPRYSLAFLWLGKTRERQGNLATARLDYRKAAELSPDLGEAWFGLGELAYKEGDLGKAKECLERVKGDSAHGSRTWWYLGNIAAREKRPEDALEAYHQAIRSDPGFFQAYLEGGRLLLEELGQPKEAAVLLQDAVRLKPGQALPRYYLSLAYLMSFNPGAAWEQYFVLQEMAPELAMSLAPALERYH
jgi:tetratricopeptide (TPR) repeat protein